MPKPATVAGSAVGYDATSPLAALPLLTFLRQPRFDFLSLYLCAKRTEFSNTPRIVGGQSPILCLSLHSLSLSVSLFPPLSTSLLHAPFHSRSAISFNALRIYRKMQYALPSLLPSVSLPLSHFCSLGLSAVKQRRQRRTRQTRSKAFC